MDVIEYIFRIPCIFTGGIELMNPMFIGKELGERSEVKSLADVMRPVPMSTGTHRGKSKKVNTK